MSRNLGPFRTDNWSSALIVVLILDAVGIGISVYINNYLPLYLILGLTVIFCVERWFKNFTVKRKNIGKIYRLIINCSLLSLLGLIVYSGIQLFTSNFLVNQVIGSIIFILEIVLFIWLWRVIARNSWRWPSMKLTVFSIICLFLIFSFAGVQPMAGYKDTAIDSISSFIKTKQEEAEKRAAEEKAEEIERLQNLGVNNPSEVVEELSTNQELEIGLEVVEIVNAIRKERGSCELQWDDQLYEYSLDHAKNMAAQQRLFHTSMYLSYAENAWWGGGSSWGAEDIVESWMESDKHRTWLLCPHLSHVAVGVAYSSNGMYAAWTYWRSETMDSDWWYQYTPDNPPDWWY